MKGREYEHFAMPFCLSWLLAWSCTQEPCLSKRWRRSSPERNSEDDQGTGKMQGGKTLVLCGSLCFAGFGFAAGACGPGRKAVMSDGYVSVYLCRVLLCMDW